MQTWRHNNSLTTQEGQRRYNLGRQAEEVALRFLSNSGYKIIAQRYKCAYGEIDIVACQQNCLSFVEVKARRTPAADDLVSPKQMQRIFDAATFFLANHPQFDRYECRIDIIVVQQGRVTQHITGQGLD